MIVGEKIIAQFGEKWIPYWEDYIRSSEFDEIFRQLKECRAKQRVVIPAKADDVFKPFRLVDPGKIKAVVIVGPPYHTYKNLKSSQNSKEENTQESNGLALDSSNSSVAHQQLNQWYGAVEDCYNGGLNPDMDYRLDMSYLPVEEHIMLINSSLSCEKDKYNSHAQIWQNFMNKFIDILNLNMRGCPIWLIGPEAAKYEKEIVPLTHWIIKSEGIPTVGEWKHDNGFKKVDQIIRDNNGIEEVPRWFRLKTDKK